MVGRTASLDAALPMAADLPVRDLMDARAGLLCCAVLIEERGDLRRSGWMDGRRCFGFVGERRSVARY